MADLLPAATALAAGNAAEAEAILASLTPERAAQPPVRLVRAICAWRNDDLAGAIAVLRPAHEADPDNGSYAEVLAALYALVGDLGESLFLGKLATGMGLDGTLHDLVPPDFPTFGRAFLSIEERPLVQAARRAEQRDRPGPAIHLLRDHLELFPQDHDAWCDLIRLLLSQRRSAEAEVAADGLQGVHDAVTRSLVARARCAAGAHAVAAGIHDGAVIIAEQGDPAALAVVGANRIADMWWCEPDTDQVAHAADGWVARHCPDWQRPRRPAGGERLAVGVLLAGNVRPDIQSAVAQIARAFNRQNVLPIGFGIGGAEHPRNAVYRNAFHEWRDVRGVDPATLARIFTGEGLDVVVDAAGFGYAPGVLAVAASDVPLRLLWPQLPMASAAQPYDASLCAGTAMPSVAGSFLPFGLSDIPATRHVLTHVAGATDVPTAQQTLVIGCDLSPEQADKECLALIAAIAMAVPGAVLALRDNGFSQPKLQTRLLDSFGKAAAATIQLVQADDPIAFCRMLDISVAPLRPSSAAPIVAALSAGCPVLTLERAGQRDGGYRALLSAVGLAGCVAGDPSDLIRLAAGLAAEPGRLHALGENLRSRLFEAPVLPAALADGLERAIRLRLSTPR